MIIEFRCNSAFNIPPHSLLLTNLKNKIHKCRRLNRPNNRIVNMDSRKDSSTIRKTLNLDSDSDKNTNSKSPALQRTLNDNAENVFTSLSNQTGSNLGSSNGPPSTHFDSSSNELGPQASKSCEHNSECNKNISVKIQGNKVNNCNTDSPESASCSKPETMSYNIEAQSCQRHKVCMNIASNSYVTPSTSGINKDTENSTFRENRKRPSTLKLKRPNLDAEDSSSDTGNDDYSLGSEDGCIYTYRGGQHLADLPSSFFSLDMGLPLDKHLPVPPNYQVQNQVAPARENGSRASSPDMDFLEMDFDPGPSCEVDTGDESSPDEELEAASNMLEENEPVFQASLDYVSGPRQKTPVNMTVDSSQKEPEHSHNVPSTSHALPSRQSDVKDVVKNSHSNYGLYITHVNVRGEHLLVRRTMSQRSNVPGNLHVSSGDLLSPKEVINYEEQPGTSFSYQTNQGPTFESPNQSAWYDSTMAQKLTLEHPESENNLHNVKMDVVENAEPTPGCSTGGSKCVEPDNCMIWSEREANERQVTQIATSACGATAVVNVFIALGVPVNKEKIMSSVGIKQRANTAPLPRYLLSRAVAGCTAADLVTGIQRASDGLVTARFFPTYPERAMSLSHWLADWISLGAVPILTLNLQVGCDNEIPDAWHHQMVFGVSPQGVYLCNPVECVRESALWPRLTSPSVLLVRTRDILSRFNDSTDLTPLMAVPDRRFRTFNVLGQVVNVIREWRCSGWSELGPRTQHIRVPAAYQAGVTVAALTGSEAHRRLMHSPQLPILGPEDPA